jgi:hypothetical protein
MPNQATNALSTLLIVPNPFGATEANLPLLAAKYVDVKAAPPQDTILALKPKTVELRDVGNPNATRPGIVWHEHEHSFFLVFSSPEARAAALDLVQSATPNQLDLTNACQQTVLIHHYAVPHGRYLGGFYQTAGGSVFIFNETVQAPGFVLIDPQLHILPTFISYDSVFTIESAGNWLALYQLPIGFPAVIIECDSSESASRVASCLKRRMRRVLPLGNEILGVALWAGENNPVLISHSEGGEEHRIPLEVAIKRWRSKLKRNHQNFVRNAAQPIA